MNTFTFTRENTPDGRSVAGRMCTAIREVTGNDTAPITLISTSDGWEWNDGDLTLTVAGGETYCRETVRHGHLTMIAGLGARDLDGGVKSTSRYAITEVLCHVHGQGRAMRRVLIALLDAGFQLDEDAVTPGRVPVTWDGVPAATVDVRRATTTIRGGLAAEARDALARAGLLGGKVASKIHRLYA